MTFLKVKMLPSLPHQFQAEVGPQRCGGRMRAPQRAHCLADSRADIRGNFAADPI